MSSVKRKVFSILLAIVLAAGFSLTIDTQAGAATTLYVSKWTEDAGNPVFDPAAKAYYPTVVKVSDTDYRMWYGSDSGVGYATSPDGLAWTEQANPVTGLTNANHPLVEYIGGKYIMWYWDTSQLYSINAIRYAESSDGTTWVNDQAITGNIITGVAGDWNRGSYGPIDVLYNPTATNSGANPFDYSFAMYFDATTGGVEEIGLGYSSDGKSWTLYGKVLPKGSSGAWDSSYATFGTVIKDADGKWHMWYSGGQTDSNDGIGYACSTDGLNWTKDANNPIMHQDDGLAWRAERTYTPQVINDGGVYKMWFSGKDAGGNYAIGYATADGPFPSIQPAISVASSGDTIIVSPGTYLRSIQVDKALTLVSTGGAAVTTIKGVSGDYHYMVRLYHSDVTLQGFTVTNPDYSGTADASGILVGDYLGAGGVSNVQVLDNMVTQVRSDSGSPSNYGATGINIGRAPISDVVISGNTITDIHNPAGASIDHTCGINIWDNAGNVLISGNTISDIKYNGILLQYVSNVQVVNNLITDCQTGLRLEPYSGAAVSNATVTNGTLSGNSGDGMYNLDSSPAVTNCIIWGNGGGINNAGTSAPVVSYCDVQGGYTGTGNMDADPIFVGGGDYHLQATSPCVDTGSNGAPSLPSNDFEGDPRIVDGNGDSLAVADMGADEYLPPPSPPVVTLHPTDQSIIYGSNAKFTAAASGIPAPTVQWQVDNGGGWANILGATNKTLIVATPPVSYSGYHYRAVFTNSQGGATTNAATLTVAGGGGGGGGVVPQSTVSEVGSVSLLSYLDWQGRTRIKIILVSDDGVLTIVLFSDTLVSNVEGNPLESMGIVTLSTPPPPPGYVLVGHAYDCLPDEAHFSPDVNMTFAYDEANIPDGVNEQDLVIAYWDGSKWINLPTSIDTTANTATSDSGHFTPFALLAYTGFTDFSASNLSIQPAEVQPNEAVTITLSVANSGDIEGSYNVVLKINGFQETEKSVTVAAGESQDVSFSLAREEAGSYSVDVNGLTGSFTVVAPPVEETPEEAPEEAEMPISWGLIWIIIATAVLVGLIIFLAVRRSA
jgi:parallel beta-helix repeat protein